MNGHPITPPSPLNNRASDFCYIGETADGRILSGIWDGHAYWGDRQDAALRMTEVARVGIAQFVKQYAGAALGFRKVLVG